MRARPELLAPAGNAEKLAAAFRFGADAAYFGVPSLSLRARAEDITDISAAVAEAHGKGRKLYAALNLFARDDDFGAIEAGLEQLAAAGVDAVIASDLGVIATCRKRFPTLAVHVSTQANTLNTAAASVFADLGCKRIVLARELRLAEIAKIANVVGNRIELECFVHGAMCVSYSGRCLLSDYLTGRASNRGQCVQACRFPFELRVAGTDRALTIEEDARGTYILNSADLCLIRRLKELRDAGVDAFKIEGRNKTVFYVAAIVGAYRRALDGINAPFDEALAEECRTVSNRGFCEGFCFDDARVRTESAALTQTCTFVASVDAVENGRARVTMRNRFRADETLEVLSPGPAHGARFVAAHITYASGAAVDDVKLVGQSVLLDVPPGVGAGDILRRREGA